YGHGLAMSSDNAQSAITYTSISSDLDGSSWGIPLMNADEFPEMDPYEEVAQQGKVHPLSPTYVSDPMEGGHATLEEIYTYCSPPRYDVAESSAAAAARAPKSQYDFVDTVEAGHGLICSPGHDAWTIARVADRIEDVGYVRALQASEQRMMTSIEEVNLRTLETHMSRMKWQRQSAEDLAITQMMCINALEVGAQTDTVEDASSSCMCGADQFDEEIKAESKCIRRNKGCQAVAHADREQDQRTDAEPSKSNSDSS
nr:hypothetical protein [Tanacetum cinerariifolium]